MKYVSTSGLTGQVSFKEAVIQGIAPDNGLFYPEYIPLLPSSFFHKLRTLSLPEIGYEVMQPFVGTDLNDEQLLQILEETLNFSIPLVEITPKTYTLELFHGPTLAFTDKNQKITVLVATSGDTGSAVGKGFLNVPGVEVKILYPAGKVSKLQEQQLTTLGHNIQALEIDGTFDDCQRMVKEAFRDKELNDALQLTSANSINVARWLPQSIYYFWALAQWPLKEAPVISVPSGNYGNLAAGLLAKAMGLPVKKFIASSNANDVFPTYLKTGSFQARPSIQTLSNAMDVGNPSNFPRIEELYDKLYENVILDIYGTSCSDAATRETMHYVWENLLYTVDPHGAVGYYGLENYRDVTGEQVAGIFLETAHPAKFNDTIQDILGKDIEIPERLREALDKPKKCFPLANSFVDLKNYLLNS